MGFNFPNAPTTGQLYPASPAAGQGQYKWDGEKWAPQGLSSTSSTLPDAPNDGTLYGRKSAAWSAAVEKSYVDAGDAAITGKVAKAGDTMTGDLTVSKATPVINLDRPDGTTPTGIYGKKAGLNRWRFQLGDAVGEGGGNTGSQCKITRYDDAGALLDNPFQILRDTGQIQTTLPVLPFSSWTAAQQQVARQAVYAAPFDAMAYNGIQINGSGDVSQELGASGGTIAASGGNVRPCDGWNVFAVQASGAVSISTNNVSGFAGFPNGIRVGANNSNFTAAASGDAIYIRHVIEGYRAMRLGWGAAGASPLTYAMNFYSTVAGTIAVRLFNSAVNRIYYQEHTVAAGSNWLTATIPGDVSGTWLKDNGVGIYFDILLGGKETTPAVAAAGWGAGPAKVQTTNSTNLMGTTNNTVVIYGFIVLPGSEAPPAARAPFIMRPYDQELLTCKRYYELLTYMQNQGFVGQAVTASVAYATLAWHMEKRATPTGAISNFTTWQANSADAGGTIAFTTMGLSQGRIANSTATGLVAGNAVNFVALTGGGAVKIDARL